jgi:hypothetical protein
MIEAFEQVLGVLRAADAIIVEDTNFTAASFGTQSYQQ